MSKNNLPQIRVTYAPNRKWPRGHLLWIENFCKYLENYFDVSYNILQYNYETFSFKTLSNEKELYEPQLLLRDTELIVENMDSYEIVIFTFTEFFEIEWARNPYVKQIFCSHYNEKMLPDETLGINNKILPFFGLDLGNEKYQKNWESLRTDYDPDTAEFEDLFIRCSGIEEYRRGIYFLNEKYSIKGFDTLEPLPIDDYIKKLKKHKLALSYFIDMYHGNRYNELCYRDMEYAACGIPFIRIEYTSKTWEPLIPNFHYISIPLHIAEEYYKNGGNEAIADLIMEKYNEVKDNNGLLKKISDNLKLWYDNYASPEASKILAFEKSILKEWTNPPSANLTYTRHLNCNNPDGFVRYKDFIVMQSPLSLERVSRFLEDEKIETVIEIGTAFGGFSKFLYDKCQDIGANFLTIDLHSLESYKETAGDEDFLSCYSGGSCFDEKNYSIIKDMLSDNRKCALFCDGGDKISEVNTFAKLLKQGDFLLAHDYYKVNEEGEQTSTSFFKKFYWQWVEIWWDAIKDECELNNIVPEDKYELWKAAWFIGKKI